tara:strand:- start:25284 stop:26180 length:897 start_codon:yes stop_codon:yes gene_type:complete
VIAANLLRWSKTPQAPDMLEQILKRLDVPFHYSNGLELKSDHHSDASLQFVAGALTLEIDRSTFRRNRGRARFSIAHEIGHLSLIYIFGGDAIVWAEESAEAYALIENLCDQIASHLLMPRQLMREHFRRISLSTIGIHSALKKFGVSKQALLTGIADTQLHLAAYNIRKYARTDNEEITWRIANCGTSSRVATSAPWLPLGATINKHLKAEVELAALEPDKPWVGEVVWAMGQQKQEYVAIICRMDRVDEKAVNQALLTDVLEFERIRQDVFDGLIAIVGQRSSFDIQGFLPEGKLK